MDRQKISKIKTSYKKGNSDGFSLEFPFESKTKIKIMNKDV